MTQQASSPAGVFYVTVQTAAQQPPLGQITNGKIELTDSGRATAEAWQSLTHDKPQLHLDAFVVMPNHLHGLLFLGQQRPQVGAGFMGQGFGVQAAVFTADLASARPIISQIVARFKQATAVQWAESYDVRAVTSEQALNALRHAIYKNPANWYKDPLNPHTK